MTKAQWVETLTNIYKKDLRGIAVDLNSKDDTREVFAATVKRINEWTKPKDDTL